MRTVRPLIGIPADRRRIGLHPFHAVGEKYIVAVLDAGGALPLLIPSLGRELALDDLLDVVDGLVLPGSPSNVEPHHYQGAPSEPGTWHDPARDATTLPLIPRAVAAGIPVLGICRGFQEMNVAYGGTLWQEVHQVPGLLCHHENAADTLDVQYGPSHEVQLVHGGLLHAIAGHDRLCVNSLHHQGVRELAPGLVAEAHAPDGLIEALRVRDAQRFAMAVQWHPEWKAASNTFSSALFARFAASARERAAERGKDR
jgi:putative glutamine amidotransferase